MMQILMLSAKGDTVNEEYCDLAARAGTDLAGARAAGADSPSSASEPISSSASRMTPSEPSAGPSEASIEASGILLAVPSRGAAATSLCQQHYTCLGNVHSTSHQHLQVNRSDTPLIPSAPNLLP